MPEEDRGENKVVLFYASKGLFKHNVSNTICLGLQLLNFFFGCDNVFFYSLFGQRPDSWDVVSHFVRNQWGYPTLGSEAALKLYVTMRPGKDF